MEKKTEEKELLLRVSRGDETALRQLYDQHASSIYRFALSRLGNAADAGDVVHEVFFDVWRRAARGFRGTSALRTWLLGIANHKVKDQLRRRRRLSVEVAGEEGESALDHLLTEELEVPPPGEEAVAAAQRADWLHRCLQALAPLLRQALYLAFYEERPYSEIALILDCPEGTVKTRVFHGRKKMRECLEKLAGIIA